MRQWIALSDPLTRLISASSHNSSITRLVSRERGKVRIDQDD